MQYKQVDKDYFIYIEKNEKVMDTLTRFCRTKLFPMEKYPALVQ